MNTWWRHGEDMVHSACITVLKLWMPAPFTWGLAKSLALPKSMSFTLPRARVRLDFLDFRCLGMSWNMLEYVGMFDCHWNGIGMLECWNVGMGLMLETELVLFQREFIDRNSTCFFMWISAPRGPMSTFSALKMTRNDSKIGKCHCIVGLSMGLRPSSLGKSWDNPPFLRLSERCFRANSWDSNFKSRWTIWASRRYWISVFRLFRVPVTVFQSVSQLLCLPYFRSSWPPLWSGPSNASEFNISPETSEGLETNPWKWWENIWKSGKKSWTLIWTLINIKMNEHDIGPVPPGKILFTSHVAD